MSFLSSNIRYLRTQLNHSQQKVADDLTITRGRYAKYEDGASEPPLEILMRLSRYYHVSIDLLVSVDLRNIALEEILTLPDNRIVLPVKVDEEGENKIEIIPHKAKMGYLLGYSDPEYIEQLQNISLPFLKHGKYRAFPVEGDSMPPYKDGAFIIGSYLESIQDLKIGQTYIWVSRAEGISYKRLKAIHKNGVELSADNQWYEDYFMPFTDIFEIWAFACSINTVEFDREELLLNHQDIFKMFKDLKKEIVGLKKESN